MKYNYSVDVQLRCFTCGDTDFELNEDKSWIKCNRCEKEYLGGYDELVELNKDNIESEFDDVRKEIEQDLETDIKKLFKKAFAGNKHITIK